MVDQSETTGEKRTHRVGLNLDSALYSRLIKACGLQKHREGQLAWILIDWALPYYEKARSVEALHATDPVVSTGRISRETQEVLFTALRTILDRAPSTVIEEIAELLTERAGKYGDVTIQAKEDRGSSPHRRAKSG
jgi:hypothetical protein